MTRKDEPDELTVDEQVQAAIDYEAWQRQWLKIVTDVLRLPDPSSNCGATVRRAHELVQLAACERATRILRSDLGPELAKAEAIAAEAALVTES